MPETLPALYWWALTGLLGIIAVLLARDRRAVTKQIADLNADLRKFREDYAEHLADTAKGYQRLAVVETNDVEARVASLERDRDRMDTEIRELRRRGVT